MAATSTADAVLPDRIPSKLSLRPTAGTDIWRKPPSHIVFDAQKLYREIPLADFKSASVTVHAKWKTLYDQGGLLLFWGDSGAERWVKTGIEFTHGKPHVSTVSCDRWADWSLYPLSGDTVTVEMEREVKDGKPTSTLWIYMLDGEERRPLREITWVFEGLTAQDPSNEVEEAVNCKIGIYAAKPNADEDQTAQPLEVHFEGLQIDRFS